MKYLKSKTILSLGTMLLLLVSCTQNEGTSSSDVKSSDVNSSDIDESESQGKSEEKSSSSGEIKQEEKVGSISFGEKTSLTASSPSEKSYLVSGIEVKSLSFENCYGDDFSESYSSSNALKMGSGKKSGSFSITFNKAYIITKVAVLASLYTGDTAVEYNLSSTANSAGMSITIDGTSSTSYTYLNLDNGKKDASTSIFFSANAKGRIYVNKLDITYLESNGNTPSSSSSSKEEAPSSSSSSNETGSSSSNQEPDIETSGYYKGINWNSTGATLKTALFNVISQNTHTIGYGNLWAAYEKTDLTDDGYIWDMYSNEKYKPSAHGGNYSKEGDCYNREHTIPQSVFSEREGMRSDIFHVIPTDGYVNNRRSNYPHGNVSNATYTSKNGSKLGTGDNFGYKNTVFEVIDEYKGDIARSYFYFVTRYQSNIPNYNYGAFAKNTYPSLSSWAIKTYLAWNDLDPVSPKEIKRNEAAYGIQKNRNPFIDHPEAAHKIWDEAIK